jgi:hypothetical protein
MKNNGKKNSVQLLVMSAICLALCMVLPFLTGQIPEIGNALSPMHIPVLLCGFLCGPVYALCVGAIAPDYAGPGGTIPEARGLGINRAIVQKSFRYLKDQGFQYAVNGSVAPAERRIVERVVDVIAVEDSEDAYANLLRRR